jgi:hypothetical protein
VFGFINHARFDTICPIGSLINLANLPALELRKAPAAQVNTEAVAHYYYYTTNLRLHLKAKGKALIVREQL